MVKFNNIVYDSRTVKKGDLFCAIKGFSVDGNDFVDTAVKNGAIAVLSENEKPKNFPAEWIKCGNAKQEMAKIAKNHYGVNFDEIFCSATTGTNGKTSIATITYEILSQIFGEENAVLLGTAGNRVCGEFFEAERTTPEAVDTLKMLGTAKNKIKAFSMEASSHALVLDRLAEFFFDLVIFSNLTQDHLDFHGTMEDYYQAKKRLFTEHVKPNGIAIINIDDEYGRRLFGELGEAVRAGFKPAPTNVFSVGFSQEADYRISDAHCDTSGTFFKITREQRLPTPQKKTLKFRTKLIGHFNVINCAQAVCGLLAKGFDETAVIDGLAAVKQVEGRIDKVELNSPFSVFVDYAHTPDALIKVLSTARKLCKGNLICVFGAGGNRDKTKRPPMAEAVAKNCDFAILTSDNPRNEEPSTIISDVKEGFPSDFPYETIIDRKEAIKFALKSAKAGDCVIIAGKGHEKYQEIAGVKHHFDDKEVVIECQREEY
ncbi:MAG: UDP-N-acetylmuramoyl-L-alanyl-D-glutamate--2,6-diaminopimelate ligase [Chitinivibrionia bacterium]|nr:UDP-N-acetylmuramoyl-L-alanyl-D-glutamate--2,6-diaminopimelate ligase [Chitinivibrionia bacterium]